MNKIILSDLGIVSALGTGQQATWQSLFNSPSDCISFESGWIPDLTIAVGKVPDAQLDKTVGNQTIGRCHQLAALAYRQIKASVDNAIKQFGAHRVGVIVGTSTAGTFEAEAAFSYEKQHQCLPDDYHCRHQEMGAPAHYIAAIAGAKGVVMSISTACSSGAKAMVSASNMLNSGLLDAVIVGGADSLCHLTVNGFYALESLSTQISKPFSQHRSGINIGEGAALFLIQKGDRGVALLGHGETSDAHHMSAPHPQGDGALSAMQLALKSAGIGVEQLDYINLHGTATPLNDQMEAAAVHRLGAAKVPCSSTKPLTGHTLAGAGAIEAGICWLAMSQFNPNHQLPPHHYDGQYDSAIAPIQLVTEQQPQPQAIRYCLSNSFAFGGSNVSLLLAREYE